MSSIDKTGVNQWLRLVDRASDADTADSGFGHFYTKNGALYFIDDAGTVTGPFATQTGQTKLLFSQTADKTIADTTTPTGLFGTGVGSLTLPAGLLAAGSVIRITMTGHYSTTGTPTFTLAVNLGGTELATTGAKSLETAASNIGWKLEFEIVCRTTGATGTVVASGIARFRLDGDFGMVKTTAVTVDTTGTLAITAPGTWGPADASNSITTQTAVVEHLNVIGLS
jgi:hypothetical protein